MRRFLVPLGITAAAVTLGLVMFSPGRAPTAAPSPAVLAAAPVGESEGQTLFESYCSSCHGAHAEGSSLAPNLHGVGAATVDLWVSSGWMPLAVPDAEPARKPPLFNEQQTVAIADYVASLDPGVGPPIPTPDLSGANVARGFTLFSLNCAPCHTITGAGDALSNGLSAPPLHGLTPLQVTEAIETGPGNMPRFGAGILDGEQARDVAAYVTQYIQNPHNPGGIGLGGVGPVGEGYIGLFIGVGACLLAALWIGDRTRSDDESEHEGDHGDGDGHHEGEHPEVTHV